MSSWTLVTAPTEEPVTLDDAKVQCRVFTDDDDAQLQTLITTARRWIEDYCGIGLLTQTWRYTAHDWAVDLPLPMAHPLQSVTSVTYYADDGTLTTLPSTAYLVDTASRPGRLLLAPLQTFPSLQSDRAGWRVAVTYVVGQSDVSLLEEPLVQAIKVLVQEWYQRTGDLSVVTALVGPYRMRRLRPR